MSCFASISMQTAGPPFPEVKITASICTRQTPLIWRLPVSTATSYFRGPESGEKNSERKWGKRPSWEPRLWNWWPLHIWDGTFPLGRRPFISPSRAVDWLGAGSHCQDYARLKRIVWSQSAKKRADSRHCMQSPARAPFLKRTQFASVRQMEPD